VVHLSPEPVFGDEQTIVFFEVLELEIANINTLVYDGYKLHNTDSLCVMVRV
jgi:hypothetical protein